MSQAVELLPWRRFKLTTAKFLSMLWVLILLIAAPPAATESGRTRVLIDAAHHNFHTASERYAPLVKLLEESGFAVASTTAPLTRTALRTADVVVIANALHVSNVDRWQQPVKPAFSASEIALLTRWVKSGGSLLLIADHFPSRERSIPWPLRLVSNSSTDSRCVRIWRLQIFSISMKARSNRMSSLAVPTSAHRSHALPPSRVALSRAPQPRNR